MTHLLDNSGTVIEKYSYDVFGAPTFYDGSGAQIPSTAYDNRFLFAGREYAATYRSTYTPSFTFYEYRARAYNPQLGRFMSEDPTLFNGGDYNLYRYCHNDPEDLTDPMGLEGDAGGAGRTDTSSTERLWDMTKWFDRSNTIQGNFPGFAYMSAQSDRDANGGMHIAQITKSEKATNSQSGVPAKLTRSVVGGNAWTDERGTHWSWIRWKYRVTDASGQPVAGVMLQEGHPKLDSPNDLRTFHPFNKDNPTDRKGEAIDNWKLGFTSDRGSVHVTQEIRTPLSPNVATVHETMFANGGHRSEEPMGEPGIPFLPPH